MTLTGLKRALTSFSSDTDDEGFDPEFYRIAYPDIAASGQDPLRHYRKHGRAEGRFPSEAAAVASAFDAGFYLERNPDVARSGADPLTHYLTVGAREGRDPSPQFRARDYMDQTPPPNTRGLPPFCHYVVEGRKRGRAGRADSCANPDFVKLYDTIGVDAAMVEATLRAKEADVVRRLDRGVLGEMVARAAALDPLVRYPATRIDAPAVTPFGTNALPSVAALAALHEQAERRSAEVALIFPDRAPERASRAAAALAHALAERGGEELVLLQSSTGAFAEAGPLPACRKLDFAAAGACVPGGDQRSLLLFTTLRSLGVKRVYSVGNDLFLRMAARRGAALEAGARSRVFVFDDTDRKTEEPLTQRIAACFEHIERIVAESESEAERLRGHFMLAGAAARKICALTAPEGEEERTMERFLASEDDHD